MYEFLTGYMFWLSIGICLIGLLVQFVLYFKGLSWQLDRVAYKQYPALGFKGAARSIIRWMIPFVPFLYKFFIIIWDYIH